MKNLTMKKWKILLLSIFAVTVLCLTGVGVGYMAAKSSDVTITLDKKLVALEKGESYTFDVTVNGSTAAVKWEITDDTVAKVENGTVIALKEGNAVVTAKVEDKTARCQIKVSDNGLVLNVVTNVGNEKLNILVGDTFDLSYEARYNKKNVPANISVEVLNKEIATVSEGKVTGKTAGSTQIVFEAEWNGMKTFDVIDLNVVYNLIADYENGSKFLIYNDERAGAKTVELAPVIMENGKALTTEQFEVSAVDYDDNIVSFDNDTLAVTGLSKGTTELEIVYKSKVTGNTVASVVEVEVDLYTEDRSSSIDLGKVYADEGSLAIDLGDVFADLTAEQLEGLSVIGITDITSAFAVNLTVENNVVNMSSFISAGILGDRKWNIQCEKYSYIVKVNVSEYDKYKNLVGEYVSAENDYRYVLTNDNDVQKIVIYSVSTGSLVTDGTFEIHSDNKNNGRIMLSLKSAFNGEKTIYGLYMNREPMRLSLGFGGRYIDLYSLSVASYDKAAGTYSSNNWLAGIKLNADKTCEFDVGNKFGTNQTGSYILTPVGINAGAITMTFEKAIMGVTVLTGNYVVDGGKYSFGITVNGKSYYFEQNGKTAETDTLYSAFGGGYGSVGTSASGSSGGWLTLYFGTDGTVYFDTYYYRDDLATTGTYVLDGDKNSGTITVDIGKAYCGFKHFEGTYKFDETTGKYVFDMYVYGSGYDNLRFTQMR